MVKILEKIPEYDDNQLSNLLLNALNLISEGKRVDDAKAVIEAIKEEWDRRLHEFNKGEYKADTPEKGVLRTIGYKVGNDGLPEHKRRLLLDYLMSEVLPPVGSPAHMAEWGEPETKRRYQKGIRVIRTFAAGAKTHGNMEKAVKDWQDDVLYMEKVWGHLNYMD